jgi:hypothetical protein
MGVGLDDVESAPSAPPSVAASGAIAHDSRDALSTRATANVAPAPRSRALLNGARLLLIALWLGGAVFFSFVVAPTAFAVLPARELAGAVVTRTIAVVNVGGFVISLLLLATAFFANDGRTRLARLAEVVSLAVMALACGVGHWIIAARMVALRVSMGRPIDAVAADDPLRAAFNSLHGYSVAAMGVALIAGVVALLLIGRRNGMVIVASMTKVESLDR